MKTLSQVTCILFATLVAACGGTSDEPVPISTPSPAVSSTPSPEPAAGFGDASAAKPPVAVAKPTVDAGAPTAERGIPTKLSECMRLGKELAKTGEHARARELFEAAARLDRKAAGPQVELARSYIATSSKALAIRHANKAVKLAPESSQAYNTLGRAELLRHDYDAAILAFRQATELDADNVWAWNNLGLVQLTLKNYPEAVAALAEATTRKGTEGYMWNNLGLAYEQLDQLDDARDAFDNGAKLGSVAAKASRKRLEGVESIVVVHATPSKADSVKTYDDREEMPEPDDDGITYEHSEPADDPAPADVPADAPPAEESPPPPTST